MRLAPRHFLVGLLTLLLLVPMGHSESRRYLPGVRQLGGEGDMDGGYLLVATGDAGALVYYRHNLTDVSAAPHGLMVGVAACTWLTLGQIPDQCARHELLG